MSSSDTASEPPRSNAGRTVALVVGSLLALFAVAVLVGGGVLLWGDSRKDDAGYLSTGTHRFHARTYAIASDNLDVNLGAPGWVVNDDRFGRIRLQATSRTGHPIFVGVARTRDVSPYLAGTAYTSVRDVDFGPFQSFHVKYRDHGGTGQPAAPAQEGFWVASAHGTGRQTTEWKVRDGNWSIVVMNADGSPGVDAGVRAGANVPFLAPAGWVTLGVGLVLLAVAAGLIVLGARRPSSRPPAPRATAVAA
jgi:hypothetical protein